MPSSAAASSEQSRSPRALRFSILRRFVLLGCPIRRVVLDAGDTERQTVIVCYESGMHVQPERARRVSVLADDAEALATRTGREVEVAAILDAERHVLPLHALQRALPMRRQNVVRIDVGLVRMLDHAVVAGHQSVPSLRRGDEGRTGMLGLNRRARHQTPGQPLVPQRRTPELVLRPALPVETVRWAERYANRRRHAEQPPPFPVQRVHVDRFHADRRRPRSRPPTASGALACKLPVGGPQAGAVVAGQVDESFHQERTVPVPLLEVPRNRAQAKAERLRGEVPAGRADQEAAHAEDAMQMLRSRLPVPSDPGVPRRKVLRWSGEPDRAQPAMRRTDQIA